MAKNLYTNSTVLCLSEASEYLASSVKDRVKQRITENNRAGLVLTGGASIVHFLQDLKKINVPWDKVTVMLSDDRLIDSNDPNSNENLLKRKFLNDENIKKNVEYISLKDSFLENWKDQYNNIAKALTHAVVILSMGRDGHVASLFSADSLLGNACLKYIKRSDFKRVTLTYQAILSAYKIYIIVYGDEKIDFFKKINIQKFYLKDLFLLSEIIFVKE